MPFPVKKKDLFLLSIAEKSLCEAARSPVLPLIWANIFCCRKGMDTPEFSSYSRTGVFEGLCKGADPREIAAECGRYVAQGVSLAKLSKFNLSRSEYFYKVPRGVATRLLQTFPDCEVFQ